MNCAGHHIHCAYDSTPSGVQAVRLIGGNPFDPEDLTVGSSHSIWTEGSVGPVSETVGLPILIYRETRAHPSSLGYRPDLDNQVSSSTASETFLMREASLNKLCKQSVTFMMIRPDSGYADPYWQSNVGPVSCLIAQRFGATAHFNPCLCHSKCIVARKDRRPLNYEQLEVIWMFHVRHSVRRETYRGSG